MRGYQLPGRPGRPLRWATRDATKTIREDAGGVGTLRAGNCNGIGQTTTEDLMQFMDDDAVDTSAADVTGDATVGMEEAAAFVDYHMESTP